MYTKIVEKLNIHRGDWISEDVFKEKLQQVFKELGSETVATGKELGVLYNCQLSYKRLGGVLIKGFNILGLNIWD